MSRRSFLLGGLAGPIIGGCRPSGRGSEPVVVYTSLDEPYARPVLDAFQRETGLTVRPVFDTEANKSRGLAQRILAEQNRPRADVFWSSEVLQILALQEGAALEPYAAPTAEGIPAQFRDPAGHWIGFAARIRVLAIHRGTKDAPKSLLELADERWKGRSQWRSRSSAAPRRRSRPCSRSWARNGPGNTTASAKPTGPSIVDGNSVAAELAARGDVRVAQTDTDDAFSRVDAGKPLEVVFPDQDGIGALLIPNTAG